MNSITSILLCTFMLCACQLGAAMQEVAMTTQIDGSSFAGTIVYDDATDEKRPALLMIPNWMGPTASSLEKAKLIAGFGYVVYMADMYGADIRPQNSGEAGKAAGAVRADIPLMRKRMNHHLSLLKSQAASLPINPQQIAAIGFCFGGGCVLELARSGADLAAVVSFHGNLNTPDAADAQQIKAKVLVLHGAVDPVVPPEQVAAFLQEMEASAVDYQFHAFGGAVHSFTNPDAAAVGRSHYDERACKRSYQLMNNLFAELFTSP